MCPLTLVVIFGGDSEYRVLDILIFVYFSLVEAFVEIRRIVVLVSYSNTDEFRHWNRQKRETSRSWISSRRNINVPEYRLRCNPSPEKVQPFYLIRYVYINGKIHFRFYPFYPRFHRWEEGRRIVRMSTNTEM